jgi:uncharacterized damage-inducible protein DinB
MDTWMKDLLDHLRWADAEVWKAVLDCEAAGADDRLVAWLYHVHVVQHAFPKVWRGEPMELPEPSDFAELAALEAWAREGHDDLRTYLLGLTKTELGRELSIPWSARLEEKWKRPIDPVTLGESVLQVAMHSTHHRGQIAARLRELGGEPPQVDFIAWLWLGRPEPRWP